MFDIIKEIANNMKPQTKENLLNALTPFIKELESMYKELDEDSNKARIIRMIVRTANELYLLLIQ